MNKTFLTSVVLVLAGMVLLGSPHRAMALEHASALRSGELLVARAKLLITPMAKHTAVLPVLMGSPNSPSREKSYVSALSSLKKPLSNHLLTPFGKVISKLRLTGTIMADIRRAARRISWINGKQSVSKYPAVPGLSTHVMTSLTAKSGKDAVVFVKPIVVFSPDFTRVYVIENLTVYAWGPVHSFYMGSHTIYSGLSLTDTKPALKPTGMQGAASGNGADKNTLRARVAVWFARHGRRMIEAIKADSNNLVNPLSHYLQGSS